MFRHGTKRLHSHRTSGNNTRGSRHIQAQSARPRALPSTAVLTAFEDSCDGLFRSSSYREKLSRACHESSPEVLSRLLDRFRVDPGVWSNETWKLKFINATTLTEKAELCTERFLRWHMARQAPHKVRMQAPWEWYPQARLMSRTFYFHHGPTNSGKTRAALQALARSHSGIYAAPLKALAAQVWCELNEQVPCDLLIGDERRFCGGAEHVSCTVEMTPVDVPVEVGVIDEVQLISDRDRGWAWTRALLGLPAREIHLCGEARAIPLVEKVLYETFEKKRLHLVEHERLVPLECSPSLGGDLRRVENGDCLVCFSRKGVLNLRQKVAHAAPDARVSVLYGAMPFAVRERQVARFNEGVVSSVNAREPTKTASSSLPSGPPAPCESAAHGRHVLVATDAIAYGLNMNVERIVFTSLSRFDGSRMQPLPDALVKQVSGRAGRFGVRRHHAVGRYTTLHDEDLDTIAAAMKTTPEPLTQAGLLPSSDILQLYAEMRRSQITKGTAQAASDAPLTPTTPLAGLRFATLLRDFVESCSPGSLFFACDMTRSLMRVADVLEDVPGLSLQDRILFCYVPLSDSSDETLQLLRDWARDHADGASVGLRIDGRARQLVHERRHSMDRRALARQIQAWERLHRQSEMYCWLSWRFRGTFAHGADGTALKQLCSDQIVHINSLLEST